MHPHAPKFHEEQLCRNKIANLCAFDLAREPKVKAASFCFKFSNFNLWCAPDHMSMEFQCSFDKVVRTSSSRTFEACGCILRIFDQFFSEVFFAPFAPWVPNMKEPNFRVRNWVQVFKPESEKNLISSTLFKETRITLPVKTIDATQLHLLILDFNF